MANEQVKAKKKGKFRTIFNLVIFLIVTVLAVIYIFKDDPKETFRVLGTINLLPFLVAVSAIIIFNLLEGILLTALGKIYNKKYHYYQGVIAGYVGSFAGAINKAAANFVQAYTLTDQDIDSAHSASIMTMNFLMYQLTLSIYFLIMIFVGYPYMHDIPVKLFGNETITIFHLSVIGLAIALFILLGVILLATNRWLHRFFLTTIINLLTKLKIVKNPDEMRKRWILKTATYRIELKRLLKHRWVMLILFVVGMAKKVLFNIIPYLCFWTLGGAESNLMANLDFMGCLCGSSYLNMISSYLVVGAPEVGFQSIFYYVLNLNGVADANSLSSAANIIWRFITFYLPIFIGAIVFLTYRRSPKTKRRISAENTTIYDLQIANLHVSDDKETKEFVNQISKDISKGKEEPVEFITQEDINASFERIRKDMPKIKESKDIPDQDLKETLEEQRKQLAKILEESRELSKETNDPEIQSETISELNKVASIQAKKEEKKKHRLARKQERKEEKARKEFEKLQPEGTKITYDTQTGLHFEGPSVYEQKTSTTSNPDEEDTDEKENNN